MSVCVCVGVLALKTLFQYCYKRQLVKNVSENKWQQRPSGQWGGGRRPPSFLFLLRKNRKKNGEKKRVPLSPGRESNNSKSRGQCDVHKSRTAVDVNQLVGTTGFSSLTIVFSSFFFHHPDRKLSTHLERSFSFLHSEEPRKQKKR